MTLKLQREDLYRYAPGVGQLRAVPATSGDVSPDPGGMPRLDGHWTVFNQWTEINDMWEGTFLERIAPGSFKKTMRENRDNMRVLFQHGRDPVVGSKPLAGIDSMREDEIGPYFLTNPLIDTTYNRDLIPGIDEGLYGISFRFRVMREEIIEEPTPSDYNPRGLPERTIKEAGVDEFGPVTFPAYPGADVQLASAGSMTSIVRDVDLVANAAPILLDEARLGRAQAFIATGIPKPEQRDEPETRDDDDADPETERQYGVIDDVKSPPDERAGGDASDDPGTVSDDESASPADRGPAPPEADAEPAQAHLSDGRRGEDDEAAHEGDWWSDPTDERSVPEWAR